MAALRFCLLACLLLAAFAPLANSRVKLEDQPDEELQQGKLGDEGIEDGGVEDTEGRKKRSPGHYLKPVAHWSTVPRKTCRTVWEKKTTPKCHTTYHQECKDVWEYECHTKYNQECHNEYKDKCRTKYNQECHNEYKDECHTEHRQECHDEFEEECHDEFHEECHDEFEEMCTEEPGDSASLTSCPAISPQHGCTAADTGNCWSPGQRDVDCPGSAGQEHGLCCFDGCANVCLEAAPRRVCTEVAHQECESVPEEKCTMVAHQECNSVPEEKCTKVAHQKCKSVPEQICTKVAHQKCERVPEEVCTKVVHKKCWEVPKKHCENHTVKVAKKVCDNPKW